MHFKKTFCQLHHQEVVAALFQEESSSEIESPSSEIESPSSEIESPSSEIESPSSEIESPSSEIESPPRNKGDIIGFSDTEDSDESININPNVKFLPATEEGLQRRFHG